MKRILFLSVVLTAVVQAGCRDMELEGEWSTPDHEYGAARMTLHEDGTFVAEASDHSGPDAFDPGYGFQGSSSKNTSWHGKWSVSDRTLALQRQGGSIEETFFRPDQATILESGVTQSSERLGSNDIVRYRLSWDGKSFANEDGSVVWYRHKLVQEESILKKLMVAVLFVMALFTGCLCLMLLGNVAAFMRKRLSKS